MLEIERKYLVGPRIHEVLRYLQPKAIRQGYISEGPDGKTVRVRTKGSKGFLTIKGKTSGISRTEFEYEIPYEDAMQLLDSFCPAVLTKDRYVLEVASRTWEIDVFHGPLEGLIVAEAELESEDEELHLPDWIAEEVSHDPRYFNVSLIGARLENGIPVSSKTA